MQKANSKYEDKNQWFHLQINDCAKEVCHDMSALLQSVEGQWHISRTSSNIST